MAYVRCSRCEARRTLARHPDEYIRVPRCRSCGHNRYRVDRYRAKVERNRNLTCCPGRGACYGYSFPHRRGSGYCCHNPNLTEEMMQRREEMGAWA